MRNSPVPGKISVGMSALLQSQKNEYDGNTRKHLAVVKRGWM